MNSNSSSKLSITTDKVEKFILIWLYFNEIKFNISKVFEMPLDYTDYSRSYLDSNIKYFEKIWQILESIHLKLKNASTEFTDAEIYLFYAIIVQPLDQMQLLQSPPEHPEEYIREFNRFVFNLRDSLK